MQTLVKPVGLRVHQVDLAQCSSVKTFTTIIYECTNLLWKQSRICSICIYCMRAKPHGPGGVKRRYSAVWLGGGLGGAAGGADGWSGAEEWPRVALGTGAHLCPM
jgi:hypothetical protein